MCRWFLQPGELTKTRRHTAAVLGVAERRAVGSGGVPGVMVRHGDVVDGLVHRGTLRVVSVGLQWPLQWGLQWPVQWVVGWQYPGKG